MTINKLNYVHFKNICKADRKSQAYLLCLYNSWGLFVAVLAHSPLEGLGRGSVRLFKLWLGAVRDKGHADKEDKLRQVFTVFFFPAAEDKQKFQNAWSNKFWNLFQISQFALASPWPTAPTGLSGTHRPELGPHSAGLDGPVWPSNVWLKTKVVSSFYFNFGILVAILILTVIVAAVLWTKIRP